MMLSAVLAACGGESEDATTPANTTPEAPATTTKAPVTTTASIDGVTTTDDPAATKEPETGDEAPVVTDAPDTTPDPDATTNLPDEPETPDVPDTPEKTVLEWYDNNGDQGVFYEISVNADGTTKVAYTKETYDDALANYGYAGYSWVNMAADISEAYTNQTKLVMKVQGVAGKTVLIKPFDSQSFEKTVTFDGSEQTVTFTLNNVSATASRVIIIFGDGGAVDTSGEFTILDAYFE